MSRNILRLRERQRERERSLCAGTARDEGEKRKIRGHHFPGASIGLLLNAYRAGEGIRVSPKERRRKKNNYIEP